MEKPDLAFLNRPKAELRRIGALVGIVITAGSGIAAGVSVSGAKAGAEQSPAVHFPNDPAFSDNVSRQGLILENLPEVLARPRPNIKVRCGLDDVGVNATQDIPESSIFRKSYGGTDSTDIKPTLSHGDEVIHLWDGITDNLYGVATASSGLCQFAIVKAAGNFGDEIRYLADSGVKVAVYSAESNIGQGLDQWMQNALDAMDYAASKGVIQILASGNRGANFDKEGQDIQDYLAAHAPESVIVVGGLRPDGTSEPLADDGSRIDVKAMFYQVSVDANGNLTADANGNVKSVAGTSLSAPQVASAATLDVACRLDRGESLDSITWQEVKKDIVSTEGPNKRLDFNALATAAHCPEAPPPPPTTSTRTTTTRPTTTTTTTTTTTPHKKEFILKATATGASVGRISLGTFQNGRLVFHNGSRNIIYNGQQNQQVAVKEYTTRAKLPDDRRYGVKETTGCETPKNIPALYRKLANLCWKKLDGKNPGNNLKYDQVIIKYGIFPPPIQK